MGLINRQLNIFEKKYRCFNTPVSRWTLFYDGGNFSVDALTLVGQWYNPYIEFALEYVLRILHVSYLQNLIEDKFMIEDIDSVCEI